MLLARGRARAREGAIRTAVGASRARIVRQLLTESLLLACIGGAAGLFLAQWAMRGLMSVQLPLAVAITWQLGVDIRVFGFAFVATLVTGLLFGLLPAWRAARTDLVADLKNQGAVSHSASRWFQLRHALVIAQVAFCVVLLVAAGLLVRSLRNARATDVGFDAEGLAVATVDLGMHRYTPDRGAAFFAQAVDRLARRPELQSVAVAERLPFTPNIHATTIYVEGATDERGVNIDSTRVDQAYFQTIGVPIVEGRAFDSRETPQSPRVAVISAAMAKRYWPGVSAVGQRFRLRGPTGREIEVIGVAADYKIRTVGEAPRPYVHYARAQSYSPSVSFLVRARGRAADAVALLRRELTALEPDLLLLENQTMAAQLETALLAPRASASLLGALGAFALVLASVGLYGVIAFGVSRRTREIGIRMALGAQPAAVLSLVVREGMLLTAIGIGLGLVLAAAVARLMSGVLYGISSIDPVTYTVMPLLLLAVAFAANLIPAMRAARIDPLTALRQD
jgi:predicted permease